ncbi:MAG: hypothetical protein GY765_18270, partial [bacterium]|nr:hypothetical protein [bacterium]
MGVKGVKGVKVSVSVSLNIFELLTYNYTGPMDKLKPGLRVVLPVANRLTTGWIVKTNSNYKGRVKNILAIVKDGFMPGKQFMNFADAVSGVYFTSMGTLLDSALSPKKKSVASIYFKNPRNGKAEKLSAFSVAKLQKIAGKGVLRAFVKSGKNEPPLEPDSYSEEEKARMQDSSGDEAASAKMKVPAFELGPLFAPKKQTPPADMDEPEDVPPVDEDENPRDVLSGEGTGELSQQSRGEDPGNRFLLSYDRLPHYREIIDSYLEKGQSVLLVAPDNSTAAFLGAHLQGVDVYNSQVKPKDRESIWRAYALEGKAGVVVGGLSAALMPIKNLGVVICDRAGSFTYKRSYFSKYDAHLLARLRARHYNLPFIEGFPSRTVQVFDQNSPVTVEDKRETEIPVNIHMIKSRTKGIPEDFIELVKSYYKDN